MKAVFFMLSCALAVGCAAAAPAPAALDASHEACQTCRMIVSDARMASQVVAPYEEPRFFDDLNCLGTFLTSEPGLPKGGVIYVADHRTRAWVRWDQAVYTRVDALAGAMGSHTMAHASAASRDADIDAAPGSPIDRSDVFPAGARTGGAK